MAKILTANRLIDGAVVFWTKRQDWSTDYRESCLLAEESDIAAAETAGQEDEKNRIVVGAYLIDAEQGESGIELKKFRERIRADGPTILFGDAAAQGKAA